MSKKNNRKRKARLSYDGYLLTKQGVRNLDMGKVVAAAPQTESCVNPQ